MQQIQTEVRNKIEMYKDQWNQTLKPLNKLLDLTYKKEVLKPEPILRCRVPVLSIKVNDCN